MSARASFDAKSASTDADADCSDVFGLGWVKGRVGSEEPRQIVVLACAGLPQDETLDPTGEVESRFRAVVERYGGRPGRVKDGVAWAIWGVARPSEHDARLAGLAGFSVVSAISDRAEMLRCGIEAGRVAITAAAYADGMGEDLPALATALDIARQSQPGAIVASAAVMHLTGEAFDAYPSSGRGSCADLQLTRLIAHRADYRDRRRSLPSQLVGRDRDLDILTRSWSKVVSGAPGRPIIVFGEPGIGKSALIFAARRRIIDSGGISVRVRCTPEARARWAAPVIDTLSRLSYRLDGLPARGRDSDIVAEAVESVSKIARQRPVALFFEDMHWADEPTLEFISTLCAQISRAKVAGVHLVMSSRLAPADLQLTDVDEVALERLDDAYLLAIVDNAGLGLDLDGADRESIVAGAGGNPFLALEIARAYPNTGAGVVVPRRLTDVLATRLAALGALKPLALAAAVFTDRISVGVLAEVLAVDVRWLEPRLCALEAAGVLSEHSNRRGRWFRFSHSLLRDAAYDSLVPARRTALHRAVASALRARTAVDKLIEPAEVAHQFALAGLRREAFSWWRRAADVAAVAALPQVAVSHLREALVLANDAVSSDARIEVIEALRAFGVALMQVQGSAGAEVRAAFQRALQLAADTPGTPEELRFDLQWGLDAFLLAGGEVMEALSIGEELLGTAERIGNHHRLLLAKRMHAVAKLLAGEIRDAVALYRSALANYDERTDAVLRFQWASEQAAVAHAHLCWAYSIANERDRALRHMRRAMIAADRHAHPHTTAHVMGVLATAAQIRGDRGMAAAMAVAGQAVAVHNGFPYWVAWCDIILGWTNCRTTTELGLRSIQSAIASYRATGARQALPYALMLLADAELSRGEPRRALEAIAAAREAAAAGISLWDSEIGRLEAMSLLRLGADRQHVDELLAQAEQTAMRQGANAFAMRITAVRNGGRVESGGSMFDTLMA